MQSSNMSLPEGFGRYRIQRKLVEGAMGAVYVAEDTQLKRQVAIKIPHLKPDGSSDLLDRFRLEAQSAATLRNPNICPVYDVGLIDGQYFISMAYIEGKSLAEVLRTGSVITERQILLLVRKLALALHDAHQHGIVHRDLKPANIMIDNRGEPVVMDFGLAFQTRVPSERLTIDGQILGSLAYMSPEQVSGNIKSLTQAVDQHALGVTLYELLTHELPYQGSLASIVNQIVNQPTPSPRKLCPTIDP
jgi:serine/threonine protein kinase